MRLKFWEKTPMSPANPPAFLGDKRVYVCHGDNTWGNSIGRSETDDPNIYRVYGWLETAPYPRVGDELLMSMKKGGWGRYVFANVNDGNNSSDMFNGTVYGAYGLSELEPKTKQCDEFIERSPGITFLRT